MKLQMRKVLSLVLALTLVLGLAPVRAAAEGTSPRYISLAQCPSFTLRGPEGVYPLEQYSNNAMVLVFGRITCGNTQALLSQLNGMVDSLAEQGIQVFANMEYTFQPEDFSAIRSAYPNITYTYGDDLIRTRLLDLVDPHLDGFVFPVVFVIDRNGSVIYYSTGYVSDMEPLLTKAEAAATNQPLPDPQPWDDRFYGSLYNYTGDDAALEDYIHQELLEKNPYISAYDSVWTGSMDIWQGEDLAYAMFDVLEGDVEEYGPYTVPDTWVYYPDARQVLIILDYPYVPTQPTEPVETEPAETEPAETEGVTWDLTDGVLTISGSGPMEDYASSFDVPWSSQRESIKAVVLEEGITTIGDFAFENCTNLTGITIPDSVTTINNYAFENCTSLSSITIPDSITTIDIYAFYGCMSLSSMTIPVSVISIGDAAFAGCESLSGIWVEDGNLNYSSDDCGVLFDKNKTQLIQAPGAIAETYSIPDSVTGIGNFAFDNCTNLTGITIPNSVTDVGEWAFGGCTNLSSITIPDSVSSIDYSAFIYCDSLIGIWVDYENPNYSSDDHGVLFDKNKTKLIRAPEAIDETYSVPDNVTVIGDYAFYNCTSLTGITMPNSVTSIGDSAFSNCASLSSITIPDSITTIDNWAFYGCMSLSSMTIPVSVTDIGMRAFDYCPRLTAVHYAGTEVQKANISIGEYNADLEKAVWHYECDGVACQDPETPSTEPEETEPEVTDPGETEPEETEPEVTEPEVTEPEETKPEETKPEVTEPEETKPEEATEATDPENIEGTESTDPIDPDATDPGNVTWDLSDGVLTVSGTGAMEDHSMPWFDLREEIRSVVIEEGITYVGAYAFYECPNLTQVTLPLSVTAMGDQAFSDCPVETVFYAGAPSQWDAITRNNSGPWNAIMRCAKPGKNLTHQFDKKSRTLTISGTGEMDGFDNVTIVPWEAYQDMIESVVVEEGVTSLGGGAFFEHSALKTIQVPATVTDIHLGAFHECNSLQSVTVADDNSTYLSENSILFDKGKTVLLKYPAEKTGAVYSIPNTVSEIATSAFNNCSKLRNVQFPNSVKNIGNWAFQNCTGLTSVNIPDSVTQIGATAFASCTSLRSVTIGSGIKDLDISVFANCTSLEEVTLPDTLVNIWECTFEDCTSLKRIVLPSDMNFISDAAFNGCTALEEVVINGVKELYAPFGNCTALKTVHFRGNAPEYCTDGFMGLTLTAYYPAGNATWTQAVRDDFGGNVTWIAMAYSGTCGDDLTWSFDNGTLTISGTGAMDDYTSSSDVPWYLYGSQVNELVIENGVTRIGDYAFLCCTAAKKTSIPQSINQVGQSAFANVTDARFVIDQTVRQWSEVQDETQYFPDWEYTSFVNRAPVVASGLYGEHVFWELDEQGDMIFFGSGPMYDFGAVPTLWGDMAVKSVTIEEGVTRIGHCAFEVNEDSVFSQNLRSVTISDTVTYIGGLVFSVCKALDRIVFTGNAPTFDSVAFDGVTATAYYPAGNSTWTEAVMQDYGGDITWLPYTHEHTFGEWITEDNLSTRTCTLCGCMEQKVTTDSGDVELELPGQPGLNADVVPVRPSDSDYVLVEEALNSAEEPNQKILKVFDINLKNSDGVHVQPDGAVKVKLPLDWEKEGNYKVYRVNDDGTLTDMNAYRQGSHMVFETDHFSLYVMVEVYEDNPFEDVALDQWYAAPVLWAVNQGITNGMTETTFAPDGTCTRAQIVTFLWRANGSPAPASANNPFTDVPAGQWYTDAVLWAVGEGITTGTSATTFSPDAGCTRGQVATFLWRAEGKPSSDGENIFTDITPGAYYYDAVLWAVENEITNGVGEGLFAPDATCTRGQIVTFLYRAME